MNSIPVVPTGRLTLRAICVNDHAQPLPMSHDADVTRHMSWPKRLLQSFSIDGLDDGLGA